MNRFAMKKFVSVMFVVGILLSATSVFAQGEGNRGGLRDRMEQRRQDRMQDGPRFGGLLSQGRGIELLDLVAEATGLEVDQLITRLQDGESLPDILAEADTDIDALAEEIISLATAEMQTAVEAGRISEDRAENMLTMLSENVRAVLNGETEWAPGRMMQAMRPLNRFTPVLSQHVAEALDIEVADVRQALSEGQSLADILVANGVEVDAFVTEHLADAEQNLAQAVETGRISQEVADARLNLYRVELLDRLNRVQAE